MSPPSLHDRLQQWAPPGMQILRYHDRYEIRAGDAPGSTVIEVYVAPNAIAARTGVVPPFLATPYATPDPTSSWHCAPYDRLEALLSELHSTTPSVSR